MHTYDPKEIIVPKKNQKTTNPSRQEKIRQHLGIIIEAVFIFNRLRVTQAILQAMQNSSTPLQNAITIHKHQKRVHGKIDRLGLASHTGHASC